MTHILILTFALLHYLNIEITDLLYTTKWKLVTTEMHFNLSIYINVYSFLFKKINLITSCSFSWNVALCASMKADACLKMPMCFVHVNTDYTVI